MSKGLFREQNVLIQGLIDRLRRFDYLFPSDTYSKAPNFDLARLESWPNWKTKLREEVFVAWMMERYDGFEDEES
jgi:hypothetical protein